jgi:5-methylcytosine-specific restriction endonuclease McrA
MQHNRNWEKANPEKAKEMDRKKALKWRKANIEKANKIARESMAKKRATVPKKIRLRQSKEATLAKNNELVKKWRMNNLEKIRDYDRLRKQQQVKTTQGKLNESLRCGIRGSLKNRTKQNRHWETLVEFTIDQLKKHLEKLFKPGMTWENYGTYWHVDHKIPKAVFNYEKPEDIDFRLCWSLKNLQPLEARKNLSKGAKLEQPYQPSLLMAINE